MPNKLSNQLQVSLTLSRHCAVHDFPCWKVLPEQLSLVASGNIMLLSQKGSSVWKSALMILTPFPSASWIKNRNNIIVCLSFVLPEMVFLTVTLGWCLNLEIFMWKSEGATFFFVIRNWHFSKILRSDKQRIDLENSAHRFWIRQFILDYYCPVTDTF